MLNWPLIVAHCSWEQAEQDPPILTMSAPSSQCKHSCLVLTLEQQRSWPTHREPAAGWLCVLHAAKLVR